MNKEIIEGVFIKESKNRFICEVSINGEIQECYVPNSSRMENYLNLRKKHVLLTENKISGRTKYSLLAVKYYNKYVLLNLNLVSSILESEIKQIFPDYKSYDVLKEHMFNGYKTDLTLISPDAQRETVLIEAKGIISTKKSAIFPKVYSERAIEQLLKIRELLKCGQKVSYIYVSLSPFVKNIKIEEVTNMYNLLLKECISDGLQVRAISLKYENGEIIISDYVKVTV